MIRKSENHRSIQSFEEAAKLNQEYLEKTLEELKINGVRFIRELSESIDKPGRKT